MGVQIAWTWKTWVVDRSEAAGIKSVSDRVSSCGDAPAGYADDLGSMLPTDDVQRPGGRVHQRQVSLAKPLPAKPADTVQRRSAVGRDRDATIDLVLPIPARLASFSTNGRGGSAGDVDLGVWHSVASYWVQHHRIQSSRTFPESPSCACVALGSDVQRDLGAVSSRISRVAVRTWSTAERGLTKQPRAQAGVRGADRGEVKAPTGPVK